MVKSPEDMAQWNCQDTMDVDCIKAIISATKARIRDVFTTALSKKTNTLIHLMLVR
jgi:hypothetical protein